MITAAQAKAVLKRFKRHVLFPEEDCQIVDLVKALRASDDIAMAEKVADKLIEQSKFTPYPSEIYELVKALRSEKPANDPDPCPACAGVGYLIVEGRSTVDPAMVITGAKTCSECGGKGHKAAVAVHQPQKRTPDSARPAPGCYPD